VSVDVAGVVFRADGDDHPGRDRVACARAGVDRRSPDADLVAARVVADEAHGR